MRCYRSLDPLSIRYSDPATVLENRFSGIVDDGAIQEVIDEIRSRLGDLCAPAKEQGSRLDTGAHLH